MKSKFKILAPMFALCSSLIGDVYASTLKDNQNYVGLNSTLLARVTHKNSSKNAITDAAITASVKSSIASDSEASNFKVHVVTKDGVVTLDGIVPDDDTKNKVISLTKEATGVKKVLSKLEVDPEHSGRSSTVQNMIPDSAITADVKAKFVADDQVSAFQIHVTTVNGEVTLDGNVPSDSAMKRAIAIAKSTNGVTKVVNKLKIKE